MYVMSQLSYKQLDQLYNAINAALNRSPRTQALRRLSDKDLDEFEKSLYELYPSIRLASGKRNKKRSTRHKKRRGKKTRKY